MPKHMPPYPPEFRTEAIRLARTSGKPHAEIARELGMTGETLRLWLKQADLDEGKRSDGLTSDEQEELRRLRRENRIVREEREILKKAAAFFAQETNSIRSSPTSLWSARRPAMPSSRSAGCWGSPPAAIGRGAGGCRYEVRVFSCYWLTLLQGLWPCLLRCILLYVFTFQNPANGAPPRKRCRAQHV